MASVDMPHIVVMVPGRCARCGSEHRPDQRHRWVRDRLARLLRPH